MRTRKRTPLMLAVRAISLVAVASAPLSAQAIVVPDGLATNEGSSSHHAPAYYAPNRVQAIYRATVLTGLGTRPITSLHLRRNGPTTTAFAAHVWRVTVHMSSEDVPLPEVSCTTGFARNHGRDHARVMDDKLVSWPATPVPARLPAAFTVAFPLDGPFAYQESRNLLVQWDCAPTSASPEAHFWHVDAQDYSGGDSSGTFTVLGAGCPSGHVFGGAAPGPMGGTLSWFWHSGAGPGLPAVGLFGPDASQWSGVPLPFDLARLGGPGCTLYTAVAATFSGRTDQSGGSGRFRVDLPVPCNQYFANRAFHVQIAVLDPAFNVLNLRVSPGGKALIGPIPTPLSARLLYSYEAAASAGRISNVPMFVGKLGLVLAID